MWAMGERLRAVYVDRSDVDVGRAVDYARLRYSRTT